MNIALVQCPAWIASSPPFGLAILAKCLKDASFNVKGFDLNVQLYNHHKAQNNDISRVNLWDQSQIDAFWCDLSTATSFYKSHQKIIDEFINKLIDFRPSSICFTVHYTSLNWSILLTRQIKERLPETPVLWGGPYCFSAFGNLLNIIRTVPEVDVVCTGDGEKDLPVLLTGYEKKGSWSRTPGYFIRALNADSDPASVGYSVGELSAIPFADNSCFETVDYSWTHYPVVVSKGCVNRCTFCNECLAHKKYQFRDPEKVVAEILHQKEQHNQIDTFWLTCSNIGGDLSKLLILCDLLIEKAAGIKWISQLAINENIDNQLLKHLKKAGCTYLQFGIESGSDHVLKLMNKGYKRKLAEKTLKKVVKEGIGFNINLVVGFPGEGINDFIATLFLVKKFQKYGIIPSVADCKILKNARLYNFPDRFGVVNHKSNEWKTSNGKNTIKSRLLRRNAAETLYKPTLINFFNLPSRLYVHGNHILGLKYFTPLKRVFSVLFFTLSFLMDKISYVNFSLWLLFIFIKLKLNEINEVIKSKREDRKLASDVLTIKYQLIDRIKSHKFQEIIIENEQGYPPKDLIVKIEKMVDGIHDDWEKLRFLKSANDLPVQTLSQELSSYTLGN